MAQWAGISNVYRLLMLLFRIWLVIDGIVDVYMFDCTASVRAALRYTRSPVHHFLSWGSAPWKPTLAHVHAGTRTNCEVSSISGGTPESRVSNIVPVPISGASDVKQHIPNPLCLTISQDVSCCSLPDQFMHRRTASRLSAPELAYIPVTHNQTTHPMYHYSIVLYDSEHLVHVLRRPLGRQITPCLM